jgi:peptidyl-prolyl cis-trans isomerase SurA
MGNFLRSHWKIAAIVCATLIVPAALSAAAKKSPPLSAEDAAAHNPTRAQASKGNELDRVVAVVNDGVVLKSELDAQVLEFSQRLRAQNVALPPDRVLREQVLERLVVEEIQAQRAQRAGIHIGDEQVNAALERMAQAQNVPFAQLPEKMAEAGYIYADFRNGVRRQMAREILQDNDVIEKIRPTPRELDEFIERQKKSVSADSEYNVSHILVALAQDASAATSLAARKKIEDIAARIAKGEAFSQLAVTYSDSQTALEGGSLGWLKGTALPTFLADVVGRMKPGETTGIIQTASGFHIARLNDVRTGSGPQLVEQLHLRHILLKTNAIFDDATTAQKLNDLRNKIVNGADFAIVAAASSEDPGSAVQGGDLGWSDPASFVPEFTAVAKALKDNEISKPFRSQYGWHIVQMLGRRTIDNADNAARAQAYGQLRESRAAEAVELWLQQLRDEAYVELRL